MDRFNSSTFGEHVEALMNAWRVPGLAMAIVQGDEGSVDSRAFGYATLDPEQKCTTDSLFDIASCSKSLTAASVALMVENDEQYSQVTWKTTMSSLLPADFVMSEEEHTRGVTVEDVLSHRTGLPSHDSSYLGVGAEEPDTARSVTRNLRNLETNASIRSTYQYCNQMFTVATHLIEELSGMCFGEYLRTAFFEPLNMTSSNLHPSAARRAGLSNRLATPYVWQETTQTYKAIPWAEDPEAQGAGSIVTSVNDYIKYVKAIMLQEAPFSPAVYNGLLAPRIFANNSWYEHGVASNLDPLTSWAAYAAGWEVYYYRGHQIVRHDGCISGFSGSHFFLPQFNFGGVFLGNSSDAGIVAEILMKELIDDMIHVPQRDRVDWNKHAQQREEKDQEMESEKYSDLKTELLAGAQAPRRQMLPLSLYTGQYWNAGYHGMTVAINDDRLFINAGDRSMGFTLTFEHVYGQTHFIAKLVNVDDDSDVEFLRSEFKIKNDTVTRMGLHIEQDLDHLVWFDKVDTEALS